MKVCPVLLLTLAGLGSTAPTQAQIRVENPGRVVERNAEWRANRKVDEGVNRGFDKVEEGIGNLFKKKEKKPKADRNVDGTSENAETPEPSATGSRQSATANGGPRRDEPKSLKAYSKFDFVPGEKIVAAEDFGQDAVGDFPAKWNTNASGEIVTLDGQPGKWLQLGNKGVFFPEFVKTLPDNATVEFDLIATDGFSENQSGLKIYFPEAKARTLQFDQHFSSDPQAGVDIHPTNGGAGTSSVWVFDKAGENALENTNPLVWKVSAVNRVSLWKQKTRLRIYLNETKIWDLPRAFAPDLTYSLLFATHIFGEGTAYLSNLRVAVGAPDTRNKLLTEGRLVTRGIQFDVNSATIKPESFGTLKEIAGVLAEAGTVRVRIVGHTDSDGDEASNLALSKRRAEAVKTALTKEFSIAADRLDTDGKGENQPAEPNTTPQGKANNRRVEFVKL